MNENEFYQACAELLNAEHIGAAFPYYKRNRWNNREPGRGRYPGCGIIRDFGSTVHVALTAPIELMRTFNSRDEALTVLTELLRPTP